MKQIDYSLFSNNDSQSIPCFVLFHWGKPVRDEDVLSPAQESIIKKIQSLFTEMGRVPGERAFLLATGITRSDLWAAGFSKYSEAVEAANLAPNKLNAASDPSQLLKSLATLVKELGRFPTKGDIKVARAKDKTFPSYEAYFRLGGNAFKNVPRLLMEFCLHHEEFRDVASLVEPSIISNKIHGRDQISPNGRVTGYVYLVKFGEDYKIGRSNDVSRRRREISLLLPKDIEHIHVIETDDPVGIERYWHQRFEDRKIRGEWFRLKRQDVVAFKRRKYQ